MLCCVVALTVGRVVLPLSGSVFVPVSLCVGAHGWEVVVAHGRGLLSSRSPSVSRRSGQTALHTADAPSCVCVWDVCVAAPSSRRLIHTKSPVKPQPTPSHSCVCSEGISTGVVLLHRQEQQHTLSSLWFWKRSPPPRCLLLMLQINYFLFHIIILNMIPI